ncbi:hypothetical protein PF007_g15614 [Phytophthora fragariae]|uniref:Secreted protein n=1 Tax=Phytophthora fragariae TaxID=53985 RepID=A0A6A3K7W0_9STRA|nr:hypothetical protein PF009_g16796 [Phytophthora fragariae]KAE8999943.1 hypothetical protein PF011_g14415 [Phytophthora fragariae]KAE9100165.1 hypothetical protein PF007_g15614 [Phytophthora fragariae]KAE9216192.1 hypothetical protein PF004_g14516 [Phytophthora fragariae]KAE9301028.1 hypothetical protein PF001_g14648 [Phytophthora fragariae]
MYRLLVQDPFQLGILAHFWISFLLLSHQPAQPQHDVHRSTNRERLRRLRRQRRSQTLAVPVETARTRRCGD